MKRQPLMRRIVVRGAGVSILDTLRDGLWWVEAGSLSAGFVVKSGRVVRCAPILRRRLAYWATLAVFTRELP